MTEGAIMRTMEERDRKDEEKAAQKAAKGASRTRKVEPEVETELEDEGDSEHGSPAGPASFDENYRLRPDFPLRRRLRSSR